jgi:hypothetical protein
MRSTWRVRLVTAADTPLTSVRISSVSLLIFSSLITFNIRQWLRVSNRPGRNYNALRLHCALITPLCDGLLHASRIKHVGNFYVRHKVWLLVRAGGKPSPYEGEEHSPGTVSLTGERILVVIEPTEIDCPVFSWQDEALIQDADAVDHRALMRGDFLGVSYESREGETCEPKDEYGRPQPGRAIAPTYRGTGHLAKAEWPLWPRPQARPHQPWT